MKKEKIRYGNDLTKTNNSFNKTHKVSPILRSNKIGRNEKCSCGSGKKYKKCCFLRQQQVENIIQK